MLGTGRMMGVRDAMWRSRAQETVYVLGSSRTVGRRRSGHQKIRGHVAGSAAPKPCRSSTGFNSRGTTMSIDWNAFTPWPALAGGVLIGTAAGMLVLLNGRIAGISGVVGGLLRPARGDIAWRAAFVIGLVVAPILYALFAAASALQIDASYPMLVIAGLLVGVGTRYGAGCTSGHGVCGISRLSPRSLVAIAVFMAAGFATVFVLRHLLAV
jgi:uncharacterized membrane protein YedE/YeeE